MEYKFHLFLFIFHTEATAKAVDEGALTKRVKRVRREPNVTKFIEISDFNHGPIQRPRCIDVGTSTDPIPRISWWMRFWTQSQLVFMDIAGAIHDGIFHCSCFSRNDQPDHNGVTFADYYINVTLRKTNDSGEISPSSPN